MNKWIVAVLYPFMPRLVDLRLIPTTMTLPDPEPPRHEVDLRRLPSWAQYVIALAVVAVVVALAWFVGRDRPVPTWVSEKLVPGLAWIFIIALVATLMVRLVRGRGPKQ